MIFKSPPFFVYTESYPGNLILLVLVKPSALMEKKIQPHALIKIK